MRSLLLKNCIIVTQNSARDVIKGDILIEDGKIADVKGRINQTGEFEGVDFKNQVVMPALINCHLHLGETVFRGSADGMNLYQYLGLSHGKYLDKAWNENKDSIHSLSSFVTLAESIHQGVGTVAVSRGWEQVRTSGINGFSSYPIIKIAKLEDYYNSFLREDNINSFGNHIFVQSLLTIEKELLQKISCYMKSNKKTLLFIHVAETLNEIECINNEYGKSPIQVLDDFKLLNENTICVHCVYLSEDDISLIKKRKANIVFCPSANFKLKSGNPAIERIAKEDIPIAIATDGLATNNSASLLEAVKFAGITRNDSYITPQLLLDMITINAAKVLGIEKSKGSIEVGKDADLSFFQYNCSSIFPKRKLISNLIYNCSGFVCSSLLIRGQFIMRDKKILTFNEEKIVNELEKLIDIIWYD